MVRQDANHKCYYCEECEIVYIDKKKACECEEGCNANKSCKIEITKNAINKNDIRTI
ncbi:MAG: hypothetical protein AABW79_03050 [Nanoarchaeota archaeon]